MEQKDWGESVYWNEEAEMRMRTINCVGIACLLVAVIAWSIGVPVPDLAGIGGDQDQVETELNELHNEYTRVAIEWDRTVPNDALEESDSNLSDEEWLRLNDELFSEFPGPDWQLLPRYLDLAKAHPDSPFALDALFFVIERGGKATGDIRGKPWQLKEQAIDVVQEHHMDDPRVVHVLDSLSDALPSQKTESFLRSAFDKSPDRATRAAAGLYLARYLYTIGRTHHTAKQLKDKEPLLNHERYWTAVIIPYLE